MTRNERAEQKITEDGTVTAGRASPVVSAPLFQLNVGRLDLEETVEHVATLVGWGLLVGTIAFASFGKPADSWTSRTEPTTSAIPEGKRAAQAQSCRQIVEKAVETPATCLSKPAFRTKIVIHTGKMSGTRYVLRSYIAAASPELHDESNSMRSRKKVVLEKTESMSGFIDSETNGTVLKIAGQEILIQLPNPARLKDGRRKASHVLDIDDNESVRAGNLTIITTEGGA